MAIKNNNLAEEAIKDSNGMFYHLNDLDSKKQERPKVEEEPIEEKPKEENKIVSVSEFVNYDSTFNESAFLTKANNMFVKFLTNIMMDRLPEIKHFVSDEVYAYGERILNNAKEQGHRQMYDELNVYDSRISSIEVTEDYFIINLYLQSRYMEYIISLDDGNYISGNNTSRIEVNYDITLKKKRATKNRDIVRKCPTCGGSIDVNSSGKCEYCGTIYNQEDYDWVITSLEKLN